MDRQTVSQLETLYRKREDLQRAKDECQHNFWVGIINDAFKGNGTRSSVLNAVGGVGPMVDVLHRATVAKIDAMQLELDGKIEALGGQP